MADLNELQSSQPVKVAGASSTGAETNFVDATNNGALHVNLRNGSGTEIGLPASPVSTSLATSLPTGTNSVGSVVPLRPSERPGATPKHGYLVLGTGNRVFVGGTVTAGKTLYVTSINISAFNTSTSSHADVRIRDGAGGVEILPFAIAQAGLGGGLSSQSLSGGNLGFPEPKKFTTSVAIDIISGTVTYSAAFSGYEV